jgi:AcrR family transcriptional regulator
MHEAQKRQSARRQPQQRRALETVDVVLQGAVRVLGRDGVDAVTTNRIAEAAGVSIGSLYQYFPDKRAIFAALHELHACRVKCVIEQKLEHHAESAIEPLALALLDGLIDEHAAHPAQLHMLLAEQPYAGPGLSHALGAIFASRHSCAKATVFMLPPLIDVLVHRAVLSRPSGLPLAEAKAAAARAVTSCLRA